MNFPVQNYLCNTDSYYQQAGFVVYPQGGEVPRHTHLPIERHLIGTSETKQWMFLDRRDDTI